MKTETSSPPAIDRETDKRTNSAETGHFKYLVHYSRIGDICYLGHLEILQVVFRTLRRASIATNFSQGFNPSPKISFGPALPVGTESHAEFFIMDLPTLLKDTASTLERLNANLVPGLKITKIELHSGKVPQIICTSYNLTLPENITDTERLRIDEFNNSDSFIVNKTRKGKTKAIDIRPLIKGFLIAAPDMVQLETVSASAEPSIKPLEALTEILGLDIERSQQTKIVKTGWYSLDEK